MLSTFTLRIFTYTNLQIIVLLQHIIEEEIT